MKLQELNNLQQQKIIESKEDIKSLELTLSELQLQINKR